VVLASTFAVLGTLPLTTFTEIGFAVPFGMLLYTIVVRSVLVTSLNLDLDDRFWWPRCLMLAGDHHLSAAPGEETSAGNCS
jgi:putative drug exporter of the RND superfamily